MRPSTLVLFKAQLIYDAFKLFICFFEVFRGSKAGLPR